jgi:hypothetical protein
MSNIISPDKNFPFSRLTLANPKSIQGGAYFSKIRMSGEPVIIQTPKSLTKNGIHKTEKKIYCDVMFESNKDNEFIEWINTFETTIKNLIYEKRNLWFHSNMDYDSIDYHWQPILRSYKQHKRLLRCFISKKKNLYQRNNIQIYDEEENKLSLDNITSTSKIISILEINGLKFTQQSFQVEFLIKQIMVLKEQPLFSKCLITLNNSKRVIKQTKEEIENISDNDSEISIEDHVQNNKNIPLLSDSDTKKNKLNDEEDSDNIKKSDSNIDLEGKDISNNKKLHENDIDINNENKEKSEKLEGTSEEAEPKQDVQIKKAQTEKFEDTSDEEKEEEEEETKHYDKDDENNENNQNNDTKEEEENIEKQTDKSKEEPIKSIKEHLNNKVNLNKQSSGLAEKPNHLEESLEKNGIISEIELLPPSKTSEYVKLKNPNEVYLEIYRDARIKAKEAKRKAIQAYLEAKRIKTLYLLNEIESSDDEDMEAYLD